MSPLDHLSKHPQKCLRTGIKDLHSSPVWQIVRAHPSTGAKLRLQCSGNSRAVLVFVILFNLSLLSLLCLASRFPLRNPIANLTSSCGISSLRVPSSTGRVLTSCKGNWGGIVRRELPSGVPGMALPRRELSPTRKGFFFLFPLSVSFFFTLRMLFPTTYRYLLES